MNWWQALRAVVGYEWQLFGRHPKLAVAAVGLLFVPALYALIYLYGMWDPASHTRTLPAGLVNLDEGANYRGRSLNLGTDMLKAIEKNGQFAYRRYSSREQARQSVRQGELAFLLEVPADFSRRALPGVAPGAGRLTIYTSEGNNYSSAGLARRFAPEVAQRINAMLNETRWSLVLSTAEGSQRNLESLRFALADLHTGAGELTAGLHKARDGSQALAGAGKTAADAAQKLSTGAAQLADGAPQLAAGLRQVGPLLRGLEARRAPEADLLALRQGAHQLSEAQRELAHGLETLAAGGRQLEGGLAGFKLAVDDLPMFGSRLAEGLQPLLGGSRQLSAGLEAAREGSQRLQGAAQRVDEGVTALTEGTQRAGAAVTQAAAQATARLPDEQRLDAFVDGRT